MAHHRLEEEMPQETMPLQQVKKLKARNKPCATAWDADKKPHLNTSHLLQKNRMKYIDNILSEGLEKKTNRPLWKYITENRSHLAQRKRSGRLLQQSFYIRSPVQDHVYCWWPRVSQHLPTWPQAAAHPRSVHQWARHWEPTERSQPGPGIRSRPDTLMYGVKTAPLFTTLFKSSYESGSLLTVWKSAWVTPVFKRGRKCEAFNNWPMSCNFWWHHMTCWQD